ncbi:MAG TPA: MFS transporter, partial [Candidatus Limnocylindrales bacterium]|nr:MFS transporter [Candidatus Limnocylindrales bacterium]
MSDERLLTPAMLGIAAGAILVPLNSTMLAVALPSVMTEFSVGPSTVASLVTLYLGAVAVALPASGSLGDRFGHRSTFLVGVVGFGLASLLAATAASFAILALSRVLQAASGALVSTSSTALVRATAPQARRGAAFGLFDGLTSVSAAVGPFVGGVIVGGFGWRSLFTLSVPIALLAAVSVAVIVRGRASPAVGGAGRRIDIPGLALLATFLVALLIAIGAIAVPSLQLAAAVACVPLLAAFLRYELRSPAPAVDPRLFAARPFAAAVAGVAGATVVLHASFV